MKNTRSHFVQSKWFYLISIIFVISCLVGAAILWKFTDSGLVNLPWLNKQTPVPVEVNTGTNTDPLGATMEQGEPFKMDITLSEGQPQPDLYVVSTPSSGGSLAENEIKQILQRVSPLQTASVEETDFNPPSDPLPPPQPGESIEEIFPPSETGETPPTIEEGPLEVLRYAPEGEISVAPFISITFNHAMVPLTTISDLNEKEVPVQIEPTLPGTWRWLGTKTLTFEYDSEFVDRLPKATEYQVTVPAGTKSINGSQLAADVRWSFRTPPPKILQSYPQDEPQPLDPFFFIAFDQRIDPEKVLDTIQVFADNNRANLVLISEQEADENEDLQNLIKNSQEGRWLAFKADEAFNPETRIDVTVGPGTASAEGPLVTTEAQSFSFSTYAPLRIEQHGCSWYGDNDCPPFTPFYIRFNNQLDLDSFSENIIQVSPEIPGVNANAYYNSIEIQGETSGKTTYTVTVSGEIRDIFGQTLGKDERLTFRVGSAQPLLLGPERTFLTLDPAVKPVLSAYVMNYSSLNIKIHKVKPSDFPAFQNYLNEKYSDNPPPLPGTKLMDQKQNLDLQDDTLEQVDIDLSPYTTNGSGHFIVSIEPPKALIETDETRWRRLSQTVTVWAQVSQIGLDLFFDNQQMVAWTNDLLSGAPLEGVTIETENGSTVTTDKEGMARFDLPNGASYLTASKNDDIAILPYSPYWGERRWQSTSLNTSLRWFVFDDRTIYRPGEEVHVKGWIRNNSRGPAGTIELSDINQLTYEVQDATGNPITTGDVSVSKLGGFDFVISLPEVINLGSASIHLTASTGLDNNSYYHSFQIQEFRRPEFEVTARNETSPPYFVDGHAVLSVEAKYYAGGGLANADTIWNVNTSPGSYSPPNWSDFTFGTWQPWWFYFDRWGDQDGDSQTETFTGKTDASGFHYLRLDFSPQGDPDFDPKPLNVVAEASVTDINRQTWVSSTSLLVHPADVYVGIRTARYFVEKGSPLNVDFIVPDLDGNALKDFKVEMEAARLIWKFRSGEWIQELEDTQQCVMTSGLEPQTCSFETPVGGTYQITARVTDQTGRVNQSRFTRWVSGGQIRPSRDIEHEQVTLIPNQDTYQPGDTAEILVQSPFGGAEGLLTVTREGILYSERFTIDDSGSTTLYIPIKDSYIPNLNIQVDLNGSANRIDDQGKPIEDSVPRPAYAVGTLNLNIPPLKHELTLEVTPLDQKLEPGGKTSLTVAVNDKSGNVIADAEVAVIVVDESILSLTNYQMADPLDVFYSNRQSYLESLYARDSIILADPAALAQEVQNQAVMRDGAVAEEAAMEAPAPMPTMTLEKGMGIGGGAESESNPIRIRSDFNPLAVFAPLVRTDVNGMAEIDIELPDNLTRYRVMAVAVDSSGKNFGVGESSITARLPLMVRPSAPRFLNFGDQFELPVVLQNQTDDVLTADVVIRASNLAVAYTNPASENQTWGEESGLRVTIPANDRIEVRFPAKTILAGSTAIQVVAVSGSYSDAASLTLPVYTPSTTEAFATYGVIDQGSISQPVQYPSDVFAEYGGLEISTSSTALHALSDAVLYLVQYPYECSEQIASRVLGIAALRDVLSAFQAEGLPQPEELESSISADVERLQSMQNGDGGFPYWQRGFESNPFNTIHVTHALVRAQEKGFDIPQEVLQSALVYLKNIEQYYPSWYSITTRQTLSAYAIFVRDLAGDRDVQKAESLYLEAGLDNLSLDALGWLWPVIENQTRLEEIRRFVGNRVVETAGAANFTTEITDQDYLLLSSNRRTDAILLDALMKDNPDSDLIPKIVNGLLAHRTKGRWGNTQENIFVLLSLDRYFNTYEAQTPDFVARVWLGDTYAGESRFEGYTTEQHETKIPMNYVLDETQNGMQDLIISKEGSGRLYYRLGLRYAPTDLNLPALDMGFVVQRSYEAVDNTEDVYQDEQGIWHIKAGARVRVKIKMVADNRRYHVALVDPLPAGLEIINPELAVSGSIPQDPNEQESRYGWWWWRPWYEFQNMRDNRAEAFASLVWDGVYEYSYVTRATTPGTFIVPPTKAEEMYSPEVFGRSAGDIVIVE
ncbi:MAG: hypothetical protein CL609_12995 [Anaerolineaceae bacterium]|nr:hypothetical protein [Anaerolineaceae bacterium]